MADKRPINWESCLTEVKRKELSWDCPLCIAKSLKQDIRLSIGKAKKEEIVQLLIYWVQNFIAWQLMLRERERVMLKKNYANWKKIF